jgi:hypothetical protein
VRLIGRPEGGLRAEIALPAVVDREP